MLADVFGPYIVGVLIFEAEEVGDAGPSDFTVVAGFEVVVGSE